MTRQTKRRPTALPAAFVWVTLAAATTTACAASGAEEDGHCVIDTGDFAFPSLAGGPVQKPGDRRFARDTDTDTAPGADHLHGAEHGHHHKEAWHSGVDAIGPWVFRVETNTPGAIIEDAWLPARSSAATEWLPPFDSGSAILALTPERARVIIAGSASEVDVFILDSSEAPLAATTLPFATATELTSLGAAIRNTPAQCSDDICRFGPPTGPLMAAVFTGPPTALRLAGLGLRWDGNPFVLNHLLKAVSDRDKGPVTAEIGEILSIEEAGRLDEVRKRLDALAPKAPGNPFISYFLARNTAARGRDGAALAALEQLAAYPTPATLAVLALAAHDAEWTALRTHPRFNAALREVTTRMPATLAVFARWLVRFRASVPHLKMAVAPTGPGWFELQKILPAIALFEPEIRANSLVFETPGGPISIELIRDTADLPAVDAIVFPAAWR